MAENEIPEPPDWSDARTFFLEPDLWHEPYELDASESHHLTRVLRIREGEEHLAATIRLFEAEGLDGAPLRTAWASAWRGGSACCST